MFTKPRAELQACNALIAKGVDVYLPLIRVKPANPRARKLLPFFPRYLFIYADLAELGLSLVNWTPGVVGLVAAGGQPVPVPAELIDTLRRRLAELSRQGAPEPSPFRPGDPVVIHAGPLEGLEAVFDTRLDGKGRARVLVEILQRQVPVEIETTAIHKLDPRALAARRSRQRRPASHPSPKEHR
jgi:transcriptional antiterminator RfaH